MSDSFQSPGFRLLKGSMILALGDVFGKLLSLVADVIRARTLTAEEFGGFGWIQQTVGLFAQGAGFALGLAATRYVAMYRLSDPKKTNEIVSFTLLISLLTTALAVVGLYYAAPSMVAEKGDDFLSETVLIHGLRCSIFMLCLQTFSGLLLGVLAGLEKFSMMTIIVFLQNLMVVISTHVLIFESNERLAGAIIAQSLGFLVTFLLSLVCVFQVIGIPCLHLRRLWNHHTILIQFCLPSLLGGIFLAYTQWQAMSWIAEVTSLAPVFGMTQIALFVAADRLRPIMQFVTQTVTSATMPILSQQIGALKEGKLSTEVAAKARTRGRRTIEHSFLLAACVILPTYAVFSFAAPWIMAIFGKTFATSWEVFLIVFGTAAINAMFGLFGMTMIASGRNWQQYAVITLYGLALLLFTWWLRPYGAIGLGFSHLGALLVILILNCWLLWRDGLLSLRSLLIQCLAITWITLLSFGSWHTPSEYRIGMLPLSLLLTLAGIYLFSRKELLLILHYVRSRFFPS